MSSLISVLREERQPSAPQAEVSEQMGEDLRQVKVIYVALGTDFEKDASMLLWVLKRFPGHRVVIIHVHCPSQRIKMLGAKTPASLIFKQCIRKHGKEQEKMRELLNDYTRICAKRKVQVEVFVTTRDNIFKGIQDLVRQHRIKRLVMGSRSMSKNEALLSCCRIWLVCNGRHISTSSEPVLNHSEAQTDQEENQEQQFSKMVPEPDEYYQGNTSSNESLEVEDLKEKLVIAEEKVRLSEEKARLSQEEKLELEHQATTLEQKISDQEKEIQQLRIPQYFTQFTLSDIQKATNNFHDSHKIGEGGYGPVYRGIIRGTPVAIKKLNHSSKQGQFEYEQEVLMLSRIRHPNIVQLIGICSESSSLVYEHLQNGSVEGRLSPKNNTPALSWQLRIRIIAEQRSALIFLHSNRPCIVHADVKCHNILLDANNVSRLGDFGTARMIHEEMSEETSTCRNTTPMGTVGYMDPAFFRTGELTPKSDVYSFGIVILRLLTGLPALKIAEQVEEALRMVPFKQILDATAGEWPVVQTEQLLRLGLRCCHIDRSPRPDLMSADWRTLEILKAIADTALASNVCSTS